MITAEHPSNEDQRLAALRSCELLDTEPEPSFNEIVSEAAAAADTPIALITLVDVDRQWFKARHGLATQQTSRDVAFCAHAILSAEPMVVTDAALDERFHDNPLVTNDPHIRFYAGVPILDVDGHRFGTLCVIDRAPRTLTAGQMQRLHGLASQVSLRIQQRQIDLRSPRAAVPVRVPKVEPSTTALSNRQAVSSRPPETHDLIYDRILRMKPMPDAVLRLATVVADDSTEIDEVVSIVQSDPVLIGSVISQANSAASAPNGEITTVKGAVLRIGYAATLAAAMASSIRKLSQPALPAYGLKPEELMNHGQQAAAIAERIRRHSPVELNPGVVSAALLHHVGLTLLDGLHSRRAFARLVANDLETHAAEHESVQLDHAEVAGLLLETWKLPEVIIDAVRFHHQPDQNPRPESHAILIASSLATELQTGEHHGCQSDQFATALETLRIELDDLAEPAPPAD